MKKIILIAGLLLAPYPASAQTPAVAELQKTFNTVAANVKKAVVSVQIVGEKTSRVTVPEYFFGYVVPQERIMKRQIAGEGSGVVIDSRGYVLTNLHVVDDAVQIKIVFQDESGKETAYNAQTVGSDPAIDIALLKIDGKGPFPALRLNPDAAGKVGDFVIAVGYPFGFKQTVTSGIISALNVKLPVEGRSYEDLIQTDAAINPGNSGGPLINMDGDIIGINQSIASPTGTFAGLGFAVPAYVIKPVLDDLLAGKPIKHGWLGVGVQNLDKIMLSRYGIGEGSVIVNDVARNSPAWKAGIRRGDVLVSINGDAVESSEDLVYKIFTRRPADEITVVWLRNGKDRKTAKIIIGERQQAEKENAPAAKAGESGSGFVWEGIKLSFNRGAEVISVDAGSKLGGYIMKGDRINAVNGKAINSDKEMRAVFTKASPKDGIVFDLERNGQSMYISIQTDD